MRRPTSAPTPAGFPINPERLRATREREHPGCVVCSPANYVGLSQEFAIRPDGGVEGTFTAGEVLEGYPGTLHGGVTAALLDGAMINCLFARGVRALTAQLTVRYRAPVTAFGKIIVRAWLTASRGRLQLLQAELCQDESVKATAQGKLVVTDE